MPSYIRKTSGVWEVNTTDPDNTAWVDEAVLRWRNGESARSHSIRFTGVAEEEDIVPNEVLVIGSFDIRGFEGAENPFITRLTLNIVVDGKRYELPVGIEVTTKAASIQLSLGSAVPFTVIQELLEIRFLGLTTSLTSSTYLASITVPSDGSIQRVYLAAEVVATPQQGPRNGPPADPQDEYPGFNNLDCELPDEVPGVPLPVPVPVPTLPLPFCPEEPELPVLPLPPDVPTIGVPVPPLPVSPPIVDPPPGSGGGGGCTPQTFVTYSYASGCLVPAEIFVRPIGSCSIWIHTIYYICSPSSECYLCIYCDGEWSKSPMSSAMLGATSQQAQEDLQQEFSRILGKSFNAWTSGGPIDQNQCGGEVNWVAIYPDVSASDPNFPPCWVQVGIDANIPAYIYEGCDGSGASWLCGQVAAQGGYCDQGSGEYPDVDGFERIGYADCDDSSGNDPTTTGDPGTTTGDPCEGLGGGTPGQAEIYCPCDESTTTGPPTTTSPPTTTGTPCELYCEYTYYPDEGEWRIGGDHCQPPCYCPPPPTEPGEPYELVVLECTPDEPPTTTTQSPSTTTTTAEPAGLYYAMVYSSDCTDPVGFEGWSLYAFTICIEQQGGGGSCSYIYEKCVPTGTPPDIPPQPPTVTVLEHGYGRAEPQDFGHLGVDCIPGVHAPHLECN